jgi:two-component system, LytTR family, response regulator
MLRALIVDDDELSQQALYDHLSLFHKQRFVRLHTASGAAEARKIIQKERINVLFLDIEMPGESGFDLLNSLKEVNFFIVFTTNYAQYAIKAIKTGAIDYLIKPIDPAELVQVLKKIEKLIGKHNEGLSISSENQSNSVVKFFDFYQSHKKQNDSLIIPHQGGVKIFAFKDIVRIEGDGNYSKIFGTGKNVMHTSKTLKYFATRLQESEHFYRAHKSSLLNLGHITELFKADASNFARMSDGSAIEISRRAYAGLLEKINKK